MNRAECFIDTNILIHFKSLHEIDWLALTGASEVVLSIPRKVIGELDDHKDMGATARLRKRALDAQRDLREWAKKAGGIRPGVTVRLIASEPRIADWHALDLDEKVPDDRIIAAALRQGLGDEYEVFFVTSDFGPELKCQQHGIKVLTLPDDHRLPPLMGEDDKKIAELTSRLAILDRKEPKLRLELEGEGKRGSRLEVLLDRPLGMSDAQIEQAIKEEEARLLAMIPADLDTSKLGDKDFALGLNRVPAQEAQRFRDAVPAYLEQFRAFLSERRSNEIRAPLTVKLACIIVNDGYAPAEGIDVDLHIPDGPEVCDDESFPKPPTRPQAPARPRTNNEIMRVRQQEFAQSLLRLSTLPTFEFPRLTMPDLGPSLAPRITKTNSYDVSYELDDLRHNLTVTFKPFYCIFHSVDAVRSFSMKYQIHARNLAIPVKGKLDLILEVR